MPDRTDAVRFAVLPLAGKTAGPNEFAGTMAPHPLVYQELAHDPEYTVYNRRLTAMRMSNGSAEDAYWTLRRRAILRHTGELPIEIRGPDAERLLNRVFTRDVSKTRVGRCSYQIACYADGGMILDGVLVRLAEDRFWYGQADGDLSDWLRAHARALEVEVFDPEVWVSQVQGPDSLRILEPRWTGTSPTRSAISMRHAPRSPGSGSSSREPASRTNWGGRCISSPTPMRGPSASACWRRAGPTG